MMSIEEFKAAFGDLGKKVYEGMPVRDLFIIIADTIKGHQQHNNEMVAHSADRMTRLERRIIDLEVHNKSMEERLRDYLETALIREDAANERAQKAEKRRLPHWSDLPRA